MSIRATPSDRKRRADAWEIANQVTPENQRRVFEWARAFGYGRAIALCEAELKITPPSTAGMQSFYEYFSANDSNDRVHKAIADVNSIRETAAATGDVSEAMLSTLESEASAAILSGDPGRIRLLVNLALKARAGKFEEKKFRAAMQTNIEQGLDALAEQAQGNPEALKYYAQFREAVMKSVEAAT